MFMKKNVGFSFLIPYIPHEDKKRRRAFGMVGDKVQRMTLLSRGNETKEEVMEKSIEEEVAPYDKAFKQGLLEFQKCYQTVFGTDDAIGNSEDYKRSLRKKMELINELNRKFKRERREMEKKMVRDGLVDPSFLTDVTDCQ